MDFELNINKEQNITKSKDHIIIIVDRSGSMGNIKEATEEGINEFISSQVAAKSENTVITLVQFDDFYDVVYNKMAITDAPTYKLVPRGMTALFDAIGKTINGYDIREGDSVYVAIATDGHENASKEYTNANVIKQLVEDKTNQGWEFIFLAANMDAYSESSNFGISALNTTNFDDNAIGVKGAYSYASTHIGTMRTRGKDVAYDEVQMLKQNTKGIS